MAKKVQGSAINAEVTVCKSVELVFKVNESIETKLLSYKKENIDY